MGVIHEAGDLESGDVIVARFSGGEGVTVGADVSVGSITARVARLRVPMLPAASGVAVAVTGSAARPSVVTV